MKTFEEIGKGLIALANILYGLITWLSLYIFGSLFIYLSELINEEKQNDRHF